MYICLYKKHLCPNINQIKCLRVSQTGFLVASNRENCDCFYPKSTWISAIMVPQQLLYPECQSWNHYFWSCMLDTMMSFSGTSNWILVVATPRVNSLSLFFISLASHLMFCQRTEPACCVFILAIRWWGKVIIWPFWFLSWEIFPTVHQDSDNGEFPPNRMGAHIPGRLTTTIKNITFMTVIHVIAYKFIIIELSNKSLEGFQMDLKNSILTLLTLFSHSLFPALGLRRYHLFLCFF